MLKFTKFISVALIMFHLSCGVLGTTSVNVQPKNGNVTEFDSTSLSCEHETDTNFDYTIDWITGSSEKIAEYRTAVGSVVVEPEFSEYFEGSYSSSTKIFTLNLLSANVSLHSQSFVCRVITTEDQTTSDSLLLSVFFIRQGIITPPASVKDQKPAEFLCSAEGQPNPTYEWKMGSDDANLCDNNNCTENGNILTIDPFKFETHNRNLYCTATNEAGSIDSEPVYPNEDFDFYYCFVDETISPEPYTANGLLCSGIEFKLSVYSVPNTYTLDGGNTFSTSNETSIRVAVAWLKTASLTITCKNSFVEKPFPFHGVNCGTTPIILIVVFLVAGVIIPAIIIIVYLKSSKDNSKGSGII